MKADALVISDTCMLARGVPSITYARGCKRRIIQTARKGTRLEFDAQNWRTIFYKNATELERSLEPALKAAYAEIVG